ncbi:hypothetical protein AB0O91_39750 [Kitasatospora sp. NPDC089797]|uniref:hypothetical protein n=1 Tax=Kitasatospora sp. NPDC089797 TaxID=3155298 RepID=UPI00342DC707
MVKSQYSGERTWDEDTRIINHFASFLEFQTAQLRWYRAQPRRQQVAMGLDLDKGGRDASDIVEDNVGPGTDRGDVPGGMLGGR